MTRVLRNYHGGRDDSHRERDRALARAGVDLTLVVPADWPGVNEVGNDPFEVVELPVTREGDVNRHRFVDPSAITSLIAKLKPDIVELHEEPFSSVVHQMLRTIPAEQHVVTYTAQNIDKRFPPPFAQWEQQALRRIDGIYPCTKQAASVVAGKGFTGEIEVLPLAPPSSVRPGALTAPLDPLRMLLVGRLVAEKGVLDAVRVLANVRRRHPATLTIVGEGPEAGAAQTMARDLGVEDALDIRPWASAEELALHYLRAHILLAPSRATRTWVEQFGRMVVEAHAGGAVVVAYASGSLPEVVSDAGRLVPEGDISAMSRAVTELVESPDQWISLREAGLTAAKSCTWDSVAAGQIALYERVLAGSRSRRRVRPARAQAVARFGPPARIAGGGRPFALPVLREDNPVTRAAGRVIDRFSRSESDLPADRLKVVYVDHVARLSGGEIALVRLIGALPGVDAHVILAEDGPLKAELEQAGATVEVLALDASTRDVSRTRVGVDLSTVRSATATIGYTLRLARRLRQLRPDLVHTNSLKSGYYGSLAARLARRPVIWHLRDRIADDYLPHRAVLLTQFALRHLPDLVICNSQETLRTANLASGAASTVVASPVVHDPYKASVPPRAEQDLTTVGMVGRLAQWKGQHVFLRAFAQAYAGRPVVRGRIVGSAMFGEDDYEAELKRLRQELGLDDRVTFVGFTRDIDQELAGFDILVHASVVPEPFGQVVVEGMAAGLAVIATAAGGPMEIITPDVDGVLVAPGDVDELAAALVALADDPALRDRLGVAAVQRASDFHPDVIGQAMMAVYRDLLSSR